MNPKTVVFFCEWSSYPGFQFCEWPDGTVVPESKFQVSMCQGRISPELVLEAFSKGAWGVLIACCPPEECNHDGNFKARRRFTLLKKVLEQFGIPKDRLRLDYIEKGQPAKLTAATKDFEAEMAKLGPIPAC